MKPWIIALYALLIFTITACNDNTQEIEAYIGDYSVKIQTINPEHQETQDLVAIGQAIGNKPIVLLGEQDHGDANTFLAKTRLIKYLHQEKGFSRILFEEDFSSLLLHDINNLQNPNTKITNTLDDYWSKCNDFQPLVKYLHNRFESQKPLHFSGMDIYLDGIPSVVLLKQELRKIANNNIDLDTEKLFDELHYFYTLSTQRNLKTMGRAKIEVLSKSIKSLLKSLVLNQKQQQIFQNIVAYMDSLLANYGATIRDQQMAQNVLWYLKQHPQEKFIVWTANRHAAKNAWEMVTGEYGRRRSMGEHLVKTNPDKIFSIGFISYQGNYGRVGNSIKTIEQPRSNSLDSWLKQTGFAYGFVDLTSFNKTLPEYDSMYYAKGMNHQIEKGQWHNIFDGLFFIKDMKSCLQE